MKLAYALAFTGAGALICAAQQAAAAPRLVGTYYEDYVIGNCSNQNGPLTCISVFAQLPTLSTPYTMTLTEVACTIRAVSGNVDQIWLTVAENGANERRKHAVNAPIPSGYSSFRQEINYLILGGPPTAPRITFFSDTTNSIEYDCTIVGTITPK